MAETEAELAFLQQSLRDEGGSYDPGAPQQTPPEDDDDEDYDPSSLMPEISYELQPSNGASSSTSTTPELSTTASVTPAQKPTKQPRTMGGFVVDDDDEEEEEDETPMTRPKVASSNGLLNVTRGSSQTPQRSLSQTPNNALPPSDVSIQKDAQAQGDPGAVAQVADTHAAVVSASNSATTPTVPSFGDSKQGNAATLAQSNIIPLQTNVATLSKKLSSSAPTPSTAMPKARLPNDRVGILEDRIAEDPRGDLDAWLSLINEHRRRAKFDDARAVYDRFFKVFPSAAEQWVAFANMELEINDAQSRSRVEQIFSKSLYANYNVQLWSLYLDHVRRHHNLITDPGARQTVSNTFDFVLQHIGIDKDSGSVWQDYIKFIGTMPGIVGGNRWEDGQKLDSLRKAYQRAICVPTESVQQIWREYDKFETGLNKMTGRKFLQERSTAYMTARGADNVMRNITQGLSRTTMPRLPPVSGFDGDVEYSHQVDIWKKWIAWEKTDPLVLREEDPKAFNARVTYVYKQAIMALRFWPEIWCDAADFCYQNDLASDGDKFLSDGVAANPESCLLAFKRGDHIEATTANEEGEDSAKRRGDAVREPYDKVLEALYDLIKKAKAKEAQSIARIEETFAQSAQTLDESPVDDEDDRDESGAARSNENAKLAQIDVVKKGAAMGIELLSKTVSFAWIALMRAMRRIQGKQGARVIFGEARKKGRLTSDVYVQNALIEHYCYKDPAASRILDKAMKLFPEDENFAIAYLKHLVAINDITNARAVFETTVNRLAQKPETVPKAKPIYVYFHEYESHYGELNQLAKLEKRMADLFPEDPVLSRFAARFSTPTFNPTLIRPVVSPATQTRPKAVPTIEKPSSIPNSPRPLPAQITQIINSNSPKRPFMPDESDNESMRPMKIARGESPLKGAAGRKLAQRRAAEGSPYVMPQQPSAPQVQPLPPDVNFLLGIIPPSSTYHAVQFDPRRMVELLRNIDMGRANAGQGAAPPTQQRQQGYAPQPPQMQGGYGGYQYNR